MQKSRTFNSVRNIIWAIVNKIAIILMPFLVRTVMLYKLGAEYTGLSGLFTSLLTMLSLAELGFSNAMVYCMYEPIHNGNNNLVCALLQFYKKVYRIIGIIVLIFGMVLLPFIDYFIKGNVPIDINVYSLYAIYLFNTVISYFLFAYKSSLLTAYQRNDIISVIGLCCNMVLYGLQILVICITKNFYLYAVLLPMSTIAMNIAYERISRRLYPEIECKGKIDSIEKDKIKKRVIGIMLYKFASTTRTSFDSIIISTFLGLIVLAQYQNYYMIISSVLGILAVVSNAITASVGDSIVAKRKDDNYKDFRKFVFIYMWVAGICTVCLLCLIQPFMRMWVGEQLLLPMSLAILFCVYFYAQTMGDMVFVYRTAAGLWWQDRVRPVVETIANMILNLVFVKFWGLHGIILATIFTLLGINFFWGAKILFNHYFERSMREYIVIQARQVITTGIACIIVFFICSKFEDTMVTFCIKVVICFTISNIVFWVSYLRSPLYFEVKDFGVRVVNVIKKSRG